MVLAEGYYNLDNHPNFPTEIMEYKVYRETVDATVASLHEGEHVMPRTGLFNEGDYNNVISDRDTIFDDNGAPIIAAYTVAYPNANTEKYPELANSGYLLFPLESITSEQREKISSSKFTNFIGELTFRKFIDYAQEWDICEEQLRGIYGDIALKLAHKTKSIEGFSEVSPFDGDGRPMVHHQFILDNWPAGDFKYSSRIIDTVSDRTQVRSRARDLANYHIDAFSEHSKSATLFTLDHADEIETMFADDAWFIAAHINKENKVDAAIVLTNSIEETPWLDPNSVSEDGLLVNVDSVSTAESARRKGVAFNLIVHATHRQFEEAEKRGRSKLVVPFDTAGDSTFSIPPLAHAVFNAAGARIAGGRVDILAHVLLKK